MTKITKKKKTFSNLFIKINNPSNSIRNSEPKIISNKKQPKSQRIPIKKGQWSLQEDKLIIEWVKKNGTKNWEACGRFVQGRKGKQCREHWNNCLSPSLVKGEWTEEEDFLIMFFYEKCNGSWKKIVPLFNGRIENAIKNRFYSQLRKYATKNMNSKDRRRLCARIKLNELKNYLNEALIEAKTDFLKKTKMNEEQFNLFIKNNEQKIKETTTIIIPEERENLDSNLSTNYLSSSIEEETNQKILEEKKPNIQEKSDKNNVAFLPLENDDDIFSNDKNNSNFDCTIESNDNYSTKNIYENINTYSNDISSINSYHKENYDINDNNTFLESKDYNIRYTSMNYDGFYINSLMNIFKERNYNYSDNITFKSDFQENLESIYKINIF